MREPVWIVLDESIRKLGNQKDTGPLTKSKSVTISIPIQTESNNDAQRSYLWLKYSPKFSQSY